MGIPTHTHLITVHRLGEPAGWGDADSASTLLASGVRAVLGEPQGSETAGTRGDQVLKFTCDEVEGLDHRCTVTDEATGTVYDVVWAVRRPSMLGVHYEGGLQLTTGAAPSGR